MQRVTRLRPVPALAGEYYAGRGGAEVMCIESKERNAMHVIARRSAIVLFYVMFRSNGHTNTVCIFVYVSNLTNQ